MSIEQQPLIRLDNVTIRVRDRFILPNTTWEIKKGQNWAVLGPNGSGKSSLARALAGEAPVVRGTIERNYPRTAQDPIGYVSLGLHQRLIAQEENLDEARFFSGKIDRFVKARDTILSVIRNKEAGLQDLDRITELLGISYLLDRGIRFISTGEFRKVLIARALMKSPILLILDEPFEGLDAHSKKHLAHTINDLMNGNMQIILVTHRFEEVLPNISHVLCLKDCKVYHQGERDDVLIPERIKCLYDEKGADHSCFPDNNHRRTQSMEGQPSVLVDLKCATVKYGDLLVLDNINWTVKRGENWAILGPNGAGKTTLLSLILGDNPQAYASEIYLFGKRKGSGESIWEIKRRIGVVSSELQVHYRKRIRLFDVVLSGFFDSIGLYRRAGKEQHEIARQWIDLLAMQDKAEHWFDQLSYGERRLALLARSMVKSPDLLILDEPCQGLDKSNRKMILDLIQHIGSETQTHVIYVTHLQDEIPPCITHTLRLERPGRKVHA